MIMVLARLPSGTWCYAGQYQGIAEATRAFELLQGNDKGWNVLYIDPEDMLQYGYRGRKLLMSYEDAEGYRSRALTAQEYLEEAVNQHDAEMIEAFHRQVLRYSALATMEYTRAKKWTGMCDESAVRLTEDR